MKLAGFIFSGLAILSLLQSANADDYKGEPAIYGRRGFPGSKMAIETPLKRLISEGTGAAGYSSVLEPYAKSSGVAVGRSPSPSLHKNHHAGNSTALTGLVRWHENAAAAADRARKSYKPVLVFQMMGNLDEEFC